MTRFSIKLVVASITFLIGVAVAAVWFSTQRESTHSQPKTVSVSSLPCSLSASDKKIGPAQAVQFAECFVIGNGYTGVSPMEDNSQLSYESWDDGPPAAKALERRHDTIESKAYGIMKGLRTEDGWAVIFRYNLLNRKFSDLSPEFREHLKTVGRTVTMDAYGAQIWMEHQDFELIRFQKAEYITQ